MLICEHCLQAIRSRGECASSAVVVVVDETNPDESKCERCEEIGNNALYDI
jgi:hypothetical protein